MSTTETNENNNENTESDVVYNTPSDSGSSESEKMLTQSQVNELIGRTKAAAQEKATAEAEARYQRELEEMQRKNANASPNQSTAQEVDADKIYQQVQERILRDMQQKEAEKQLSTVVDKYYSHIENGKKEYEDFEKVTQTFNPSAFPEIVVLLSGIENGGNVLYELASNPTKLATIDSLAQREPHLAQAELRKLGKSIAHNKEAALQESQYNAHPPLDRLQSSNKAGNNGKMSVSDLRAQPWLRG